MSVGGLCVFEGNGACSELGGRGRKSSGGFADFSLSEVNFLSTVDQLVIIDLLLDCLFVDESVA